MSAQEQAERIVDELEELVAGERDGSYQDSNARLVRIVAAAIEVAESQVSPFEEPFDPQHAELVAAVRAATGQGDSDE